MQKLGKGGEALEECWVTPDDRRRQKQPHGAPALALPVGDGAHGPDETVHEGLGGKAMHDRLELG
jgi:hypothetical protein